MQSTERAKAERDPDVKGPLEGVEDLAEEAHKCAECPIAVAKVADTAAMRSDNNVASISARLCQSATYQRNENPSHSVTKRESLKLNAIRKAIGA